MGLFGRRTMYLSLAFALLVAAIEWWVFSMEPRQRAKAFRLHVFAVMELIHFVAVRIMWRRIVHLAKVIPGPPLVHLLLKAVVFVYLALSQGCIVMGMFTSGREPFMVMYVSAVFLGSVIFLGTSMITLDVVAFLLRKIFYRIAHGKAGTEKSGKNLRTAVSLLTAFLLTFVGVLCASAIVIERVGVPIKGLDPRWNGTTIAQVSDIHLGPTVGRTQLVGLVERINSLEADIVAITGDLVDSSVENLWQAVAPLAELKSKYGVFYCTGNHEYYTGEVDNWLLSLPKLNVTPLVNSRQCLLSPHPSSCQGGLYFAGLEDIETRRLNYGPHSMDLHSALSGRTGGVPTIVLAHQPYAAAEAIMWKDVRLVLSGHTHSGQIFPMMISVYLFNPFFVGLYQPLPDTFVYVNPGAKYFLIPLRHYRPEITLITLISA